MAGRTIVNGIVKCKSIHENDDDEEEDEDEEEVFVDEVGFVSPTKKMTKKQKDQFAACLDTMIDMDVDTPTRAEYAEKKGYDVDNFERAYKKAKKDYDGLWIEELLRAFEEELQKAKEEFDALSLWDNTSFYMLY